MIRREEMVQLQNKFLELRDKVESELKKNPNVIGVGIGFKEVCGEITDDVSFLIYVKVKKGEDQLSIDEIIPKTIYGFKTDVVELETIQSFYDDSRYRPIQGGIQIGNGSGGYGTLGCLAQLSSDGSQVILSNHHVMMNGGKQLSDKVKIGQPDYENCCCCSCGEIGEVINAAIGGLVDCAIAKINDGILIVNEIDGIGTIQGNATAVLGETVRKVGRTSGLTKGTIARISDMKSNNLGNNFTDQMQITPIGGSTIFSDEGDSGAVIVNNDNKIIGLLWGGRAGASVACHIGNVMAAMGIIIMGSSGVPTTASSNTLSSGENYPELLQLNLSWDMNNPFVLLADIYRPEIFHLVRHNRQVMACWQRKQGPAFTAAFWRSHKEPTFIVPNEINGITFSHLIMSMHVVLEENGSQDLKQILQKYGPDVIYTIRNCRSMHEINIAFAELGERVKMSDTKRRDSTLKISA